MKLASIRDGIHRAEDGVAGLILLVMAAIPILEIGLRRVFDVGIPGAIPIVQHLTLWVAFLGAALAAREDRLLALATTSFLPEGRSREVFRAIAATFTAAVCAALAKASYDLMVLEYGAATEIGAGIPTWVAMLVLPIAFAIIALRQMWSAAPRWWVRLAVAPAIPFGVWLAANHAVLEESSFLPWLAVIVACTLLGAPIFAALGAAAAVLFAIEYVGPMAIPVETYSLSVSPMLPAIPLFTLTGFLLAEGRSSERLLEVFRAWFGWIPGGTAVVTVLVCAFFTAFTGGSGVTILALGGLLYPALVKEKYGEDFSLGTLTAAGSLGLLFPPALPLILYGVVAEVPIEDLFIGGIIPGFVLVGLMAVWGIHRGLVSGAVRTAFHWRRAVRSLWTGKYELAVPAIALGTMFSGWATLVEAAAVTALYALIVQVFIHRDLTIRGDLLRVLRNCTVLLGGVLIILGVAKGLTNYLVDAMIPAQLLAWVEGNVESRIVFLLALNVFLLLVGCLMDIFSAIVVVVPLIEPIGESFGIHPVHLGIIFVANLELGYLTPPVGLNLFLASYRFEKPLLQIYRAAVPALLILGLGVLMITYVEGFTLGLLRLLGQGLTLDASDDATCRDMLAAMGGALPRRGRPRALLVHWKESETPARLALLRAIGFDAVHRTLSTAPVRELREARPDLIVIDLGRLPSHGLAIGLAVRQSPSLRPIPLVFVDGERAKVDRVRAQLPDAAYTDWERAGRTAVEVLANPPENPRPARSVMDGYSGRPLVGKLDIRDGDHVAIPGAPADFERTLGELPAHARVTRAPRGGADVVLWFPSDRADYERRFTRMGTLARRWLWVVWPKQSAGVRGDLDQNIVRRLGLGSGFVDSKICAVDATFSALRFSRRKH